MRIKNLNFSFGKEHCLAGKKLQGSTLAEMNEFNDFISFTCKKIFFQELPSSAYFYCDSARNKQITMTWCSDQEVPNRTGKGNGGGGDNESKNVRKYKKAQQQQPIKDSQGSRKKKIHCPPTGFRFIIDLLTIGITFFGKAISWQFKKINQTLMIKLIEINMFA